MVSTASGQALRGGRTKPSLPILGNGACWLMTISLRKSLFWNAKPILALSTLDQPSLNTSL